MYRKQQLRIPIDGLIGIERSDQNVKETTQSPMTTKRGDVAHIGIERNGELFYTIDHHKLAQEGCHA